MTWAAPFPFVLVPAVLALVVWTFKGRGTAVSPFKRIRRLWATADGLTEASPLRRRGTRGLLLAAGSVLALCALAQPQWGKIEETTYDQSREVLLAVDLSRSMTTDDVSPTRLDRAKLLIESLLDQLRGERVGLVIFAGTSFLQSPLSADYEVLRDFLRDLDPSYLPQGGTDFGSMLKTALHSFGQEGDGDRYLVVLSDGEAHDSEWKSLVPTLQQSGIRVIGLGVGTAEGGLVPDGRGGVVKEGDGSAVLSRLEPTTLKELATSTGGTYRDAASWVDIGELVSATVEQGRRGRYAEQKAARFRDRFQWLLAPALLFFLLSYWLELPVLPVPRLLRSPRQIAAPIRTAAATALLLLMLAPRGVQAEPSSLESVVRDLSEKADVPAGDYALLAEATIGLASQPGALSGPERAPVIDDALRGVDEGEKKSSQAADWPKLRAELERLKQENEQKQEEQQPQEDASQQPDQGGGESGNSDQQSASSGSQEAGEGEAPAEPPTGQNGEQNPEHGSAGASPSPADSASDSSPSPADSASDDSAGGRRSGAPGLAERGPPQDEATDGDSQNTQDEPKPLENAGIGKLGNPHSPKDEGPGQQQPARMVGGGPVQQASAPEGDVAMVEALNRMQRIEEGDSPAILFDRMNRAEGAPPEKNNGKDW